MNDLRRSLPFLLLISAILLPACTSDGFFIGKEYLNSNIRTVIIDTCTIKMTTVPVDSIVTSGLNTIMFGRYTDTTIGKIVSTSYLSFSLPGAVSLPVSEVVFDSLEMVIALNGNWLGDTTKTHTFNIYRLTEVTELPDDGDFYSTWSLPFLNTALTSFSLRPEPNVPEAVSVRLPDNIGANLLQKMMDADEEVLGTEARFLEYFKGFAITAGDDNNAILGVHLNDTSTVLRIHYHYSVTERVEGYFEITANADRCFYGITTDRSGTPFDRLNSTELTSSESHNEVLVQALTASYVRIEFPYLNNLLELGDYGTVISAELYVYPVKGTYSAAVPLPSELSIYVSTENDVSTGAITTYSGDELQTGNLSVDNLLDIDTYYSYDITGFMQEQLGVFGINRRVLTLIIPQTDLAATINTLVAGDKNHARNGTKLLISYLIYDDK
jgi:hypothetical protein